MHTANNLLEKIEILRKQMTVIALDKGFTSKESVTVSQELDRLLNLYNHMKEKE